ncbi:MAG: ABC transporter permease [bacterium]
MPTPASSLKDLWQDTRQTFRSLGRAPWFTLAVIATLSLAIGSTVTVFSIANAVLLRQLPYREPDRLAWLLEKSNTGDVRPLSFPAFREWTESPDLTRAIDGMAFVRGTTGTLQGEVGPEPVRIAYFTPGFFALLGTPVHLGRLFNPDEEREGASSAIISFKVWRSRFGGDRDVIGRTVTLNETSTHIVGVMPPDAYPDFAEFWQPIVLIENADASLRNRDHRADSRSLVRIAGTVDSAQAAAALGIVAARLSMTHGTEAAWSAVALRPLTVELLGDVGPTLLLLTIAVGFVLGLACANVASLMIARIAGRTREFALRTALGARKGRLARLLVTESLILALGGGAIGAALAVFLVALVRRTVTTLPRIDQASIDGVALMFALSVTLLTALLVASGPVVRATRTDIANSLRAGATNSGRSGRLRHVLVATQLALALVLLIGSGLLLQSFRRILNVPLGFVAEGLVSVRILSPGNADSSEAGTVALYERILESVRATPGVTDAALVNHLPVGGGMVSTPVVVEGSSAAEPIHVLYRTASAEYLRTMQMRVIRGRWLETEDIRARNPAIVVNERIAQRFWPGHDPVGKRLVIRRAAPARADFGQQVTAVVVGVVADVRHFGQEANVAPEIYVPFTVDVWPSITVVARVRDRQQFIPPLRAAVHRVSPDIPLGDPQFRALDDMIGDNLARRRVALALMSAFSILALSLAVLGLYSIVSYDVTQRTVELGIRAALGASERDVLRHVMLDGVRLSLAGLTLGVVGAAFLSRWLRTLLFETKAVDSPSYLGMTGIMAMATLLATYIPARRAARLDPRVAMRLE